MMNKKTALDDISIRTELVPGDLGYVISRHGALYKKEYDYGIEFENYVAAGLVEFYKTYDICMKSRADKNSSLHQKCLHLNDSAI